MRKGLVSLALFLVGVAIPAAQTAYYPPPGQWARKAPGEVGMDPARLNDALEFMKMHETASPARDFSDQETRGQGGNIIFISPSHDLLAVWRWSGQANEGFRRIVASITS